MNYLLDTNICIYLLNGNTVLKKKIAEIGVFSINISNTTLAELYFGAYYSNKVEKNIEKIKLFIKDLHIYSDSEKSSEVFGKIKSDLKTDGNIIEDFDIIIASIAIVNNCVLVTNNVNHFKRVKELQIQNWLENY